LKPTLTAPSWPGWPTWARASTAQPGPEPRARLAHLKRKTSSKTSKPQRTNAKPQRTKPQNSQCWPPAWMGARR
jgi:hypothetical protein